MTCHEIRHINIGQQLWQDQSKQVIHNNVNQFSDSQICSMYKCTDVYRRNKNVVQRTGDVIFLLYCNKNHMGWWNIYLHETRQKRHYVGVYINKWLLFPQQKFMKLQGWVMIESFSLSAFTSSICLHYHTRLKGNIKPCVEWKLGRL